MRRRDFLRLFTVGTAGMMGGKPLALSSRAAPTPFEVYLTFDDGPTTERDHSGPTTEVLDLLADEGIKASFFLHGRSINPWEGQTLVRIVREGHALGNHLWRQGGNTVRDETSYTVLAQQFIEAEMRIRLDLESADSEAYQRYLQGPHLYRRPGGNNGLAPFLDLKNFSVLEKSPVLRWYQDKLDWLKGVYDYSGWHLTSGDGIPAVKVHPTTVEECVRWAMQGGYGYYGVDDYLCWQKRRSLDARLGLVVLMHDASDLGRKALPQIIKEMRARGAVFRALPRPTDRPNAFTVGIGNDPLADPAGEACEGG